MRRVETIGPRLRRHLGPLTWFALSAFLCGVALPILETHEVADPDEPAFQLVTSDGGALRIEQPARSDSVPEHCLFCHWQRAISGAMVTEAITIAALRTIRSPCRFLAFPLSSSAFPPYSSRAPPLHA